MHRRAKGNGMGLGRICEDDDLLDIDWNIRGRKDMQIDGALSVGDKATTLSNIGAVSKSGDTIHGSLSVDNRVSADNFHSNYIELGSNLISGTNFGGFIDFHYEGNPVDYTSRIIEDVEGSLNLQTPNGLRVNNNALADFVIAQGSSGGWHYRKWNSGNAEIWRRDAYSVTMPYGSKGCAVDYPVNYAFPFTFTSITNANAIPDNQNLQQWIGTMTFTTSSISRVCFDSFYDVASTGYLSIRIEGKWK